MKKTEYVYRHLLEKLLVDRKSIFVEREIATLFGISPNTVSMALAPLKRSGAVSINLRNFQITSFEKLLLFWAVNRRPDKDIVYKTYVNVKNVTEIEKYMPADVAYTNCSGYINIFGNDASDYGSVYVYATEKDLKEIIKRFPENQFSKRTKGYNLFVLKPDKVLEEKMAQHNLDHSSVSIPQLYVDLWNSSEWYSYEFLKKLKNRINDMYGKPILE
jgi:hypothetical protein